MRGLFVTGTDTGVGKTVVSAALMRRLRRHHCRYWKPVETGIEQDDDTVTVARLSEAAAGQFLRDGVRLPRPLSPHLAARRHGTRISIDDLELLAGRQPQGPWIVEGAGGVLVPLNERELMIDLMQRLAMPAIIAARSGLGTINHTLLTIAALRHRAVTIAGVVLVGERNDDNRAAIEQYGDVKVVGQLAWLEPLTAAALALHADALDAEHHLEGILGVAP
jgi:dethiobiotin synthetase